MCFRYREQMGASRELLFAALIFITGKVTNGSVLLLNAFSEGQNEHTLSCIIYILLCIVHNTMILFFFPLSPLKVT